MGGDGVFVLRREEPFGWQVHCAECDHRYGPAARDPKLGALVRETAAPGPAAPLTREFFCPGCALLIALDVQQAGDPLLLAWRVDPDTLDAAAA
jgi:acetone carboxylase gamma subunit